jgi:hypothetical protein
MPTLRGRSDALALPRWLYRWLRRQRIESGPPGDAENLEAQLERRRAAALRLPPLECGYRDPLDPQHRRGLCRYTPGLPL